MLSLNLVEEYDLNDEKKHWIDELIQERSIARKNKDWKKADEIRDILLDSNIELIDGNNETKWKLIR